MNANSNLLTLIMILVVAVGGTAPVLAQDQTGISAVRTGFAQALNDHNLEAVASFLADDFVFDLVALPEPLVGPQAYQSYMESQFLSSPNWSTDEGLVLATDGIVVVAHAAMGTQTGPLADLPALPPSGNAWVWPHLDIYEFEGDKIKRLTTHGDFASLYIQLGLVPQPEFPELVPSFTLPDPEPTGLSPVAATADSTAIWSAGDLAGWAKTMHLDTEVFYAGLGTTIDRNANIALNEMYLSAFADRRAEITRAIDLGDGWVVNEVIYSGTHTGPYFGIEPTGILFRIRGVTLDRIDENGLSIVMHSYYDDLTLTTQITTPEWAPDGTWITPAPTPMGNLLVTGSWIAQNPEKTRLTGVYDSMNEFPFLVDVYPDADGNKFGGAQAVKIGRNRYQITFLFYYFKKVGMQHTEIVGIDVTTGQFELTGPDSIQGQGQAAYYFAAQDADQNGFPDEGQEPVLCLPWVWTAQRLGIMLGCDPMPMP